MSVPTPAQLPAAGFRPVIPRIGSFVAEGAIAPDAATMAIVRDAVIDLLGCIVAGAREEVAVKARNATSQRNGSARVYGTGETRAPEAAAFVNAVAGHATDFDDWEIPGNTHPSAVIVPALLAAAEGGTTSGRQFAEAYVVGFEIIARLGEALNFEHYDSGWHSTATFGPLGAAAAVARLWGLDDEAAGHAIAIAVSRAGGLTAQFGSDAKPLQAGFAAEAGLAAATLARAGLTGNPTILQGPTGYGALTSQGDDSRLIRAFDSLGTPLSLTTHGLVFKPYPSCGYTHRIVDAALALRERGIEAEGLRSIEIASPDFHAAVLPFHAPTSPREARFSLPFCSALALSRGHIRASDFTAATWSDDEIVVLMSKTTVSPFKPKDPSLNYDPDQPDRMTVVLDDGRIETARVAYPLGAPQRPMSPEQILAKFAANAEGRDVSKDALDRLADWIKAADLLSHLAEWSDAP